MKGSGQPRLLPHITRVITGYRQHFPVVRRVMDGASTPHFQHIGVSPMGTGCLPLGRL